MFPNQAQQHLVERLVGDEVVHQRAVLRAHLPVAASTSSCGARGRIPGGACRGRPMRRPRSAAEKLESPAAIALLTAARPSRCRAGVRGTRCARPRSAGREPGPMRPPRRPSSPSAPTRRRTRRTDPGRAGARRRVAPASSHNGPGRRVRGLLRAPRICGGGDPPGALLGGLVGAVVGWLGTSGRLVIHPRDRHGARRARRPTRWSQWRAPVKAEPVPWSARAAGGR